MSFFDNIMLVLAASLHSHKWNGLNISLHTCDSLNAYLQLTFQVVFPNFRFIEKSFSS